jgi:hypothetical protein
MKRKTCFFPGWVGCILKYFDGFSIVRCQGRNFWRAVHKHCQNSVDLNCTMGDAPKRLSALVSQLSVNDAESTGVAMEPTATKCVDSPVLSKLNAIERYKFVTGDEPLIKGLWPAFITPFTKAGEVDVAAVAPLCDYLIDVCKVDGIYAVGGTGEMRSIGLEARKVMCDATCKAVAGRVPVVVCVGETENIEDGVMLAEHAKSCGAGDPSCPSRLREHRRGQCACR